MLSSSLASIEFQLSKMFWRAFILARGDPGQCCTIGDEEAHHSIKQFHGPVLSSSPILHLIAICAGHRFCADILASRAIAHRSAVTNQLQITPHCVNFQEHGANLWYVTSIIFRRNPMSDS